MAPKASCNAHKLATMAAWFQKSRTVHSLKDLEKALPQVGSISGMQVKDYIQTLQDENKISSEKVGSGNWYWSFPSQTQRDAEVSLHNAQKEHEKYHDVVKDLRQKIADRNAELENEEEMLDGGGDSREDLMTKTVELEADIKALGKELALYSDNDPTELERKREEVTKLAAETEQYTDDIESMEKWLVKYETDPQYLTTLQVGLYGEEWNTEEYCFTELPAVI